MATIKEIAAKAGVSIGTVDRVLHDRGGVSSLTRDRILKIAEELQYQPNQAAQALAVRKKELKLCVLMPETEGHPYFQAVREAAEKKARELEEYGVQVVFCGIRFSLAAESAPKLQEVDGISVMDGDWGGLKEYLDEAESRSIPIVAYNSWNNERNYLACVGCDYMQSGALAAGLSALIGGENAEIAVFSEGTGDRISSMRSYASRMKGFTAEMEKRYPEMRIRQVCPFENNQTENYRKAGEMLREYPGINIAYVVNPGDYGICEAIHEADEKHQLHIITNDLTERQKEMMQKGIISATICQEPEKQGALPLEILFSYLAYGTVPESKICHTGLSIHIAQNM